MVTSPRREKHLVGVAQLVRAPDCGSGCRGFESPHSPVTTPEIPSRVSGVPHFGKNASDSTARSEGRSDPLSERSAAGFAFHPYSSNPREGMMTKAMTI